MVMEALRRLPIYYGGLIILFLLITRISAFHSPVFYPLHHQQITQTNNGYRNNHNGYDVKHHRQSTALNNYVDISENAQRDISYMQGK